VLGALIRRKGGSRAERDELALESTIFSLSTLVPRPAERRADDRLSLMLPIARLVSPGRQDLCRIRNVSAGGIMADVASEQIVGTRVSLELSSDQRIDAEVVWIRDSSVGLKFDDAVDVRELLHDKRPVTGYTRRPPRLEVECGATVRIGRYYHKVTVRDISLGGMKVAILDPECGGKKVQVTIDSFRSVKGHIAWYRPGQAGIVFDKPLRFEELAGWIGKRVEIASLRAGAWDRPGR